MTAFDVERAKALCEPSGLPAERCVPVVMETRKALIDALAEISRLRSLAIEACDIGDRFADLVANSNPYADKLKRISRLSAIRLAAKGGE